MSHPRETDLALYAGGELGLLARIRLHVHLTGCPECRGMVQDFRESREALLHGRSEMPEGVRWDRLASDMTANIHLGLAAGECVGPAQVPRIRPRWQKAVILAPVVVPLIVLLVIGVYFQWPYPQRPASGWVEGTVVEATSEGIDWRQGDRMLSLRHPAAEDVITVVNTQGTVRTRYIDVETGQITIHNVYAQ
jgi:hypothetical protein